MSRVTARSVRIHINDILYKSLSKSYTYIIYVLCRRWPQRQYQIVAKPFTPILIEVSPLLAREE